MLVQITALYEQNIILFIHNIFPCLNVKNILNQHLKNIGMFWYTIGRGVAKVCLKFPASAGRLGVKQCPEFSTISIHTSYMK